MAANTEMVRVDMVEKDVWDTIVALAGGSDDVGALIEAKEALLSLAENATALLALLESNT